MANDRNLVEYLPPFLAEFKELNVALTAENPEFKTAWDAAERVLKNEFIATADGYGIARFERLLKIFPSAEDTLESRRSRVFSRWFSELPYTERTLVNRLNSLCGEGNFSLRIEDYTLELLTSLGLFGQLDELEFTLDELLPANMNAVCRNVLERTAEAAVRNGGAVTTLVTHEIYGEGI